MNLMKMLLALLLGCALVGVASAAEPAPQLDLDAFADSQAKIRRALNDKDALTELTYTQRADVLRALDRISHNLAGVQSISELSEQQKVHVFNDQEMINSVLTAAAADSRLVCSTHIKTGSHRRITQCGTVKQRRDERQLANDKLRKVMVPTMRPPPDA